MTYRWALLTLLLLGAVTYANTIGNPFVHDDIVFILQNPSVHHLTHLSEVFSKSSFTPPSLAFANPYYRPFLDIIYRLEYYFFGAHPAGYHVINIFLHIANGFLVFFLTNQLTGRMRLSWAAAILFLLHPIQSESVACISGISNLLFSFFCLCSFLLYVQIVDRQKELTPAEEGLYFSGALISFGLALLCKEQAIILPFLIVLYEFCFPRIVIHQKPGWRLRLAGFAIVTGGYLLWRKFILGEYLTTFVANTGEFYLRLKAIPAMMLNDLRILFFPYDLHYYRSYDILAPWIIPGLGFIGIVILGVWCWKILPVNKRRFFGFGIGWFSISLLPTTSIVPLVHEYSWIAAFEHFLYLPLIGFIWCALMMGEYCVERLFPNVKNLRTIKNYFFVAVLLTCVFLTFQQNRIWAGEIPLFERAVKYEKSMGRVHLLLAKAYYFHHDFEKARSEFTTTGEIMTGYIAKIQDQKLRPFYEGFLKESLLGLAACDEAEGKFAKAAEQYEKILQLNPQDASIHNNLAVLAIRLGKWDKAEESFRAALTADPGFAPAQQNLKQLLQQKSEQK